MPSPHGRQRLVEQCPYLGTRNRRPLPLTKHRYLHQDGQRLIAAWFDRAWVMRGDDPSSFEGFVFAWIAVNAWAACVTGEDRDSTYMDKLAHDSELRFTFEGLRAGDPAFHAHTEAFFELLPIFKAQQLRRNHIRLDEGVPRDECIRTYLDAGLTQFEPACAKLHMDRGEPIPRDWPHFIQAVYRVRCNLFHGEKSVHSEMDHRIVRAALLGVTSFFRQADIL